MREISLRIAGNKDPDMPPLQRTLEDVKTQLSWSTDLRSASSLFCQVYITFAQIKRAWRVRNPRKYHKPNQGHGDGEDAIDNEEPSPARHAPNTRQVCVGCRLEITRDHRTQWIANEPCSSSLEEFWPRVPGTYQQLISRAPTSCISILQLHLPRIK